MWIVMMIPFRCHLLFAEVSSWIVGSSPGFFLEFEAKKFVFLAAYLITHHRPDITDLPRRSLFNVDEDIQEHRHKEKELTYDFGGSGSRNPLALAEAFEDFGIDDRLFSKNEKSEQSF